MSYIALARKWRPKSFNEVVGQAHVVKALSNALDRNQVHHAYLFTGTRGVGKTTLARIFAKALNCEQAQGAEPCQQCNTCVSVDEGRFVDLIEVDAASRTKVDDTRELLENVQYAPTTGRCKVYLIDEVHMLSGHSFNALLKTLEEPPEHVKFLFATTDPQKLPITVLSRCLQFNLRALRSEQIENQLFKILEQENIAHDLSAIQALARAADGSMRDGLSLLDQVIAQSSGHVSFDEVASMLGSIKLEHSQSLLRGIIEANADQVMLVVEDMADHAVDFESALDELLIQLYHLSLKHLAPEVFMSKVAEYEFLSDLSASVSPEQVQLYYQIGLIAKRDLPLAPSLRVGFEMALLRMLAFVPDGGDAKADGQPQSDKSSSSSTATQSSVNSVVEKASPPMMTRQSPDVATQQNMPQDMAQQPSPLEAVASSMAAPVNSESKSAPQIQPEPAAAKPQDEQSAAALLSGQNEWGELVEQTQLQGLSRQLAMNCASERMIENRIDLVLSPRLQHLHKDERITELRSEINRVCKREIELNLEIAESDNETPAECLQRLGYEQKLKFKENVEKDSGVKALMSEFNATIVDGSIEPTARNNLESKTGES